MKLLFNFFYKRGHSTVSEKSFSMALRTKKQVKNRQQGLK